MAHEERIDPEMRAFLAATAPGAPAAVPGARTAADRTRLVMEAAARAIDWQSPAMVEKTDHWVLTHGRRVLCRLHRPVARRDLPVALYLHGGGWHFSSIDTHDRVAREYAAGGQVAVLAVEYSLAPEAKFPHALLECAGVAHHVAACGAEWGVDGSRLLLCGDSAGGNLALATALFLRDTAGPPVRGVALAYPVCDADFTTPSYREFEEGPVLTAAVMRGFWDIYLRDEVDRLHPLAAPLRADLAGMPPVLIHVGELDPLCSEAEALAAKLRASGVPVEFEIFAGLTHGFMRAGETVGKARDAVRKAGSWIRHVAA